MSACKNHPGVAAIGRCAACAEEFCHNCLVEIQGQKYCGACKGIALQGKLPEAAVAAAPVAMTRCKTAKDALTYSLVGIILFGIILEPIAFFKALKAKREIAADPSLSGSGQATAALIISSVFAVIWVLAIVANVASRTNQ